MSIFRESFQKDIRESLENRQKAMTRRSTTDIQYLNTRNTWIRMASSVNVNGSDMLAKQYVLQGGSLEHQNGVFTLRKGIGNKGEEIYSTQTPLGSDYRLGLRPMPGITSVDIKSKSAYGSLREATVNFQCWDVAQLSDLELLYMRPGYTVLLEWGWVPYLDKDGNYQSNFTKFYSKDIIDATEKDRTKIFKTLYDRCTEFGGNYDAIFGYVKNYQWSAREDGGYDCQTTIISTGEVIESIKVNYVRGDLSNFHMYDTGSTDGKGFLDSLFTNQGAFRSTLWAEYYQKNTLAGIWAELAHKLKANVNPTAFTPLGSKILDKKWTVVAMPGLVNYGNLDTFIQPGSNSKAYITLEAAFDIINEFVLARTEKDDEPLVKLSTKTETYSSTSSIQDLLCVAHPIQISVDPTVCMIKNALWYNDIVPALSASVAPISSTIDQQANNIIKQIDDASVGNGSIDPPDKATISSLYDGNNSTHNANFLAAIKSINNSALFERINKAIVENKYPVGGGTIGAGRGYTDGLAGWINNEFTSGGNDGSAYVISGNTIVVDEELTSIWYVYLMSQHIKSLGYTVTINLTNTAGSATTLDTVLSSAGNPTLNSRVDLSNIIVAGGSRFGTYDASLFKITSNFKFTSISIIAPTTAAATAATTLVLNAADSVKVINNMKTLDQEFFVDGKRSNELGIIGNIYVSLDFLYRQSLNISLEASDTKEKNEINLYSYIKGVMSGIQVAIGNLNNFEVHVDPIDNIARVIDVNYTGKDKVDYNKLFTLQVQNLNSVVRRYTLQSQIFPNQSSIIAIGSQEKAGQGGIQNKTMTGFNNNLVDRILGNKVDPKDNNPTEITLANGLAGIIVLYSSLGAPVDPNGANNLNIGEYISRAKNALRDLIVYFQNRYDSPGANRNILPFKFSFEMDGIGGLVIGSLFKINSGVIPKGYRGDTAGVQLAQTVTGIAHSISDNDWVTKIDALNLILDRPASNFDESKLPGLVKTAALSIINGGLGLGLPPSPTGGGGPTPTFTATGGCTVPIPAGTIGFPIDPADVAFAKKFTGGVYPFLQFTDCTAVVDHVVVGKDSSGNKIKEYTYNPRRPERRYWLKENPSYVSGLTSVTVPLANNKTTTVSVHPTLAAKLKPIFDEIIRLGLRQYIKSCSGALAIRNNTNAVKKLSFHSWGLAIDINADIYGNGSSFNFAKKTVTVYNEEGDLIRNKEAWNSFDEGYIKVGRVFEAGGLGWLHGDGTRTPDPMHFSYGEVSGYP